MAVNTANPVSVGLATKKDHYDRVFQNTVDIYAGAMAVSGQAVGDLLYASSASQLARIAAAATPRVLASSGSGAAPAYSPEGSWTPAIGGSGGASGQTYTVQKGRYFKKGLEVLAYFYLQLSAKGTITGSVILSGLPFAAENVANQNVPLHVGYWTNMGANLILVGGFLGPNSAAATLYGLTAAATGMSALTSADLANTSILCGSIAYVATS